MPIPLRIILLAFLLMYPISRSFAQNTNHAVLLAYHRIAEENYPETNLSLSEFKLHLNELTSGKYNILPLSTIIDKIKNKRALPDRTIAITFEGAYRSAYENAMPLLLENNIPFTIFYASDLASAKTSQYMNWLDLTSLQNEKLVSFGILPAPYKRLHSKNSADIRSQINKAKIAYREYFKDEPKFFSYPFGEYSLSYKSVIKDQNFNAALGLHSGAVNDQSDFWALPRFSMTEGYGSRQRFELVANALPLNAFDVTPEDTLLQSHSPSIGFSLPNNLAEHSDKLSCFLSEQGKLDIEKISAQRIHVKLKNDIKEERARLNCTMPVGEKENQRWRWFGMIMVTKNTPDSEDTPN